jgi:hypothetical protein
MGNSLFRPHGAVQIEVSASIVTAHMHGHWNIEMRNQAAQAMGAHVQPLNAAGPWGIINVLHDTLIYSEEIFATSRQDYAARPASSRLAAVAFVIDPQVEGAALLRHRFDTLLEGVITSAVFADLPSATKWVQSAIAGTAH